jgi:hypothetical protein
MYGGQEQNEEYLKLGGAIYLYLGIAILVYFLSVRCDIVGKLGVCMLSSLKGQFVGAMGFLPGLFGGASCQGQEDLGLFTLENPARDLAPASKQDGVGVPSAEERHHIFQNRCRKQGHDWSIGGYANGVGPFTWLHWEIGSYRACSHCWARQFVALENEDQLNVVLEIERERWKRQWAPH